MYHVLQHNGEFKWDLIDVQEYLSDALITIEYEMTIHGGQYVIREVHDE